VGKSHAKPNISRPVERVKISDLIEDEDNPRIIDTTRLDGLKNSVARWGLVQPLVINKRSKRVVGGNQRLKVLQELGVETADAVTVDLDETEEKALGIALNNGAIQGLWDVDALLGQLNDLKEEMGDDEFLDLRLDDLRDAYAAAHDEAVGDKARDPQDPYEPSELEWSPPWSSVLNAMDPFWVQRRVHWIDQGVAPINGPGMFDPVLAEVLMNWYCPADTAKAPACVFDPNVVDASIGMVAAISGRNFVGVGDKETVTKCEETHAALDHPTYKADWTTSISACRKIRKAVDFLLTFCTTHDDAWIVKRMPLLKPDSFVVVVTTPDWLGHCVKVMARHHGKDPHQSAVVTIAPYMELPSGEEFSEQRKLAPRHLHVLVYCNGDPAKAAAKCQPWKGDA